MIGVSRVGVVVLVWDDSLVFISFLMILYHL
jgi:hypothetical protein